MAKKVAIDLTWVRHGQVGGTESAIRNVLDGIASVNPSDMKLYLLLSSDNFDSFEMYKDVECFEFVVTDCVSSSQKKRVVWQNRAMGSLLKELGVTLLHEPIYGKPWFGLKGIDVTTTIHDLQAIHYPEYFSRARVLWMKANWKHAVRTSTKVVAITDYVRKDIEEHYGHGEKIQTIYNAINLNIDQCNDENGLAKYGIEPGGYYYTLSSLLPHKNLKTLVEALGLLKAKNSQALLPLVISGVGGKSEEELLELARKYDVADKIIFTPFVDNYERNMLYKGAKVFLFPSIFEGFGMPPIEAMALSVPVLTTRCASLEEVTGGLLNYVDDPLDASEWATKLEEDYTSGGQVLKLPDEGAVAALLARYDISCIGQQYVDLFK